MIGALKDLVWAFLHRVEMTVDILDKAPALSFRQAWGMACQTMRQVELEELEDLRKQVARMRDLRDDLRKRRT